MTDFGAVFSRTVTAWKPNRTCLLMPRMVAAEVIGYDARRPPLPCPEPAPCK